MSIHHAHLDRRSTPWLPLPSLADVAGHLALIWRYATAIRTARRNARRNAPTGARR